MPKGLTRLTQEQYDEIIQALATPYYGINSALARRYDVSEATIRKIRNGKYKIVTK